MVKVQTSINIDEDLRRQAREQNLNITEVLDEALRLILAKNEGNSAGISLEIAKKSLKKARKQLQKWQNEAKTQEKNIEILEKEAQKRQEEALLKAKQEAESKKKCQKCGIITAEERLIHVKTGDYICKNCFFTGSKEEMAAWK